MALNLSTLTSSATSGDVLAEALTTADFLEPVPVLRNLARGSQKGGDAKQDTALNQPKALPLDANGKGYLYVSGVSGNYASVPDATNLDGFGDFTFQVDNLYLPDWSPSAQVTPIAKGSSWQFSVHTSGSLRLDLSGVSSAFSDPTGLPNKTTASIRAVRAGSVLTFFYSLNNGETWVSVPYNYGGGSGTLTNDPLPLAIGAANVSSTTLGKISGAKVWNNATQSGSPVLDVDFTATKIRHNDTKFVCDSGQVVTINQSGNDPATIIKKSVLRFDGVNNALGGLLNQTIDNGYFFAAFSVLGNGGESTGRVFGINSTGEFDYNSTGFVVSARKDFDDIYSYYGGIGWRSQHLGVYDPELGDILHEIKFESGAQRSRVNNADEKTRTDNMSALSSEEFKIGALSLGGADAAAIDLEYLALFPATITDAQADSVRNYINNRNNVFSLIDSQGYYFFDPQIFPIVDPADFVSYWNGNIVGSDLTLNASVSQSVVNHRPARDGYKVTFNDNADHLVVASPLSGGQAGWQIVGTSLGTFVYRVDNDAVTELNLLGNAGAVRSIGDLYGIILLPASATGKDIEDARKLLIDRGASDAVSASSVQQFWQSRNDIVEFKQVDTSSVTSFKDGWRFCASLEIFPPLQAPNCTNFLNAWQGTSALTSFPAGAKLGTSAQNVNFTDAWRDSGLQSFPALDLSKGINLTRSWFYTPLASFGAIDASNSTNFSSAWHGTALLTSFPAGAKLGTEANNVNFTSAWESSGLTSFSTPLPTATNLAAAFRFCNPLVSFTLDDLPLVTSVATTWQNTRFQSFSTKLPKVTSCYAAWYGNSALVDFSADVFANWNPSSISSGVFNIAWDGCTSLTAQSVENILTAIDASGKYATSDGDPYQNTVNTQLADAGIDIDYDGTTPSAATDSAITSLRGKGWVIFINGVERIP